MGLIYLDTCLLIYLVEDNPDWSGRVAKALAKVAGGTVAISPLVKLECLIGPVRRGDSALQREYADAFARFATLAIPEPVFLQAAGLRARFGLKTPDALHLACAQHHRCESLWTNDNRLARASRGLARRMTG